MKKLIIALAIMAVAVLALSQSLCFLVGGQYYSSTIGNTKGQTYSKKFYFNPLNSAGSPSRYCGYATAHLYINVVAGGKTTSTQLDSCKLVGWMIDYKGNRVCMDSIVAMTYATVTEGDTLGFNLHNDDAFTTAGGVELKFTHYNKTTADTAAVSLGVMAN